jgi:UDP-N-acetylmuramoylalanine--D-glutamate ligase
VLLEGSGTVRLKHLLNREKIIFQGSDFKEAVHTAHKHAEPGDTILLSPGFASFGMFSNEFDRGQQFNALVQSL